MSRFVSDCRCNFIFWCEGFFQGLWFKRSQSSVVRWLVSLCNISKSSYMSKIQVFLFCFHLHMKNQTNRENVWRTLIHVEFFRFYVSISSSKLLPLAYYHVDFLLKWWSYFVSYMFLCKERFFLGLDHCGIKITFAWIFFVSLSLICCVSCTLQSLCYVAKCGLQVFSLHLFALSK